jgi:hypothetical protein
VNELVDRLLGEDRIGTAAAGRLVGADQATITRWCQQGVRLPDGSRLKLEYLRVGGRLLTSRQAITRFLAAQQPLGADQTPAPRTPAQHERAADRAAAALEAMGA